MKRFLFLLVIFAAGCAAPPQGTPPEPAPPPPPEAPAAPKENVAIAGLMESARADAAAGKLVQAAASPERALRIEPRNPRLWHELARVRLRQGDTAQAANLAARSNSFAGNDGALRSANQNIIEQARTSR